MSASGQESDELILIKLVIMVMIYAAKKKNSYKLPLASYLIVLIIFKLSKYFTRGSMTVLMFNLNKDASSLIFLI